MTMRDIPRYTPPIGRFNTLAIPAQATRHGPVKWRQYIGPRALSFILEWNEFGRFFVLAIWDGESELVRTVLQYGWDILDRFQHIEQLRGISMVPFDPALAEMEQGITMNNLGKNVFVFWHEAK